jgi:hypothetical protein
MGRVIRRVTLLPRHAPTGAVKHSRFSGFVEDESGGLRLDHSNPLPPPASLAIVTYGAGQFNLIHLDANGRDLTDTFHESVDDALEQASFEFTVQPDEWTVVSEPYE